MQYVAPRSANLDDLNTRIAREGRVKPDAADRAALNEALAAYGGQLTPAAMAKIFCSPVAKAATWGFEGVRIAASSMVSVGVTLAHPEYGEYVDFERLRAAIAAAHKDTANAAAASSQGSTLRKRARAAGALVMAMSFTLDVFDPQSDMDHRLAANDDEKALNMIAECLGDASRYARTAIYAETRKPSPVLALI